MRVAEKKGGHAKREKQEICVSRKRRADTQKKKSEKLRVVLREKAGMKQERSARRELRKHPDLLRKSG